MNSKSVSANNTGREYRTIDLVKFVCAFLVVAIHTEPFDGNVWLDRALGVLTRIPVPFFFTAAGFFLFLPGKGRLEGSRLRKYVSRLAVLYVCWSAIYLPFFVSEHIWTGGSCAVRIWRVIDAVLLTGVSSHLWFVAANILAAILTWWCYKKLTPKATLAIAGGLLVVGTLLSTYRTVVENVLPDSGEWLFSIIDIIGTRNGLFYGFFYFALGGAIAAYQKNRREPKFYLGMFAVGMLLLAGESVLGVLVLNSRATVMWLTAPIAVYALFMLATNLQLPVSDNYAKMMRNASTLIYTSQFLFIHLLRQIGFRQEGMVLFMGSAVLAVSFAVLVIKLSKKYTFLRYLF